MAPVKPLTAEQLCRRCSPERFSFQTTAEVEDLEEILGQDRAVEAIRFGIGIRHPGYNMFALGPPGTGRHSIIRQFLEKQAADEQIPPDWCYVNNFTLPHKPRAVIFYLLSLRW